MVHIGVVMDTVSVTQEDAPTDYRDDILLPMLSRDSSEHKAILDDL